MAKHLTGRTKIVVAETLSPEVRAVVSTYAVGFGMEVETVPHRGGTIDPAELGAAAEGAAIVLFQQPSFLGCLEPAPELAAAAEAAGALACAHVDPLSLGVLAGEDQKARELLRNANSLVIKADSLVGNADNLPSGGVASIEPPVLMALGSRTSIGMRSSFLQ
jgi:hypothetical protein